MIDVPAAVMQRATGNTDVETFRQTGEHLAAKFISVIEEHAADPPDILDWGCGPGRVAVPLLLARPGWKLRGCDVDAEAVAYCNDAICEGAFVVTGLTPPLPCEDQQFDAVIACSVFTHLDRVGQVIWLREMARVLRPGGILAASVHGEPARRAIIPRLPDLLADNGIFDQLISTDFEGILPHGYYRATFQSEKWTTAEWGKYLEVISYQEAGLTRTHDLVVCRNRSKS